MCQTYKNELHCEEDQFFCGDPDRQCILERWTCDGNADCPNGFDEHPTTCPNITIEKSINCLDQFPCKKTEHSNGAKQICLPWELVCNNNRDCPEGDDEGRDIHIECSKQFK